MVRGKSFVILLLVVLGFISCESQIDTNKNNIYAIPDEQFAEEINNLINSVSYIFDQCEDVGELIECIPAINDIKYVEKAYISENALIVKVSEGGKIMWDFPRPEIVSETDLDLSDYIIAELKSADLENHNYSEKKNLAIVIAERITSYSNNLDVLAKEYEKRGFKITPIYENNANIDFFRNRILSFDNVVLETHGNYDEESGLHWILTGERADYSTFIANYEKEWNDGSICLLKSGKLCITENFVKLHMVSYPEVQTIFFNNACLSMAGNENLANELIKKGVRTYLGYNISNYLGHIASTYFYLNMLNGYNVAEAREKLSEVNYTAKAAGTGKRIVFSKEQANLKLVGATEDCFIHPMLESSVDILGHTVKFNMTVSDAIPDMKVGFCYSADTKTPDVNNSEFVEGIIEAKDIDNNRKASISMSLLNFVSPQEHYYRPFIIFDGVYYYGECSTFTPPYDEVFAFLFNIYLTTEGWNWEKDDNWFSEKPYEEWYGVSMDEYGFLTLDLSDNNLNGTLDLNSFDRIKELYCSENEITDLNASGCSALETLCCSDNQLRSLLVSGCFAMTYLDCARNQLSGVSFDDMPSLKELDCSFNRFAVLSLKGMKKLEWLWFNSESQVELLDLSGCISLEEIRDYEKLYSRIGCDIVKLDISGCTSLSYLECTGSVMEFMAEGCTALTDLYVESSEILDVSGCLALENLDCTTKILDLDDCVNLKELILYDILFLRLESYNSLEYLYILSRNGVVDIYRCSSLKEIECSCCSRLSISNCSSLAKLDLKPYFGDIDELVIKSCNSLEQIQCSSINLSSLTVESCPEIWGIECNNNQISSFNISDLPSLSGLYCSSNQISSLDVSGFPLLSTIDCSHNEISSFIIEECSCLERLYCQDNRIIMQIPDWFDQIRHFWYDHRFDCRLEYNEMGDEVLVYIDNGIGWWYLREMEDFLNQ